MKRILLAVLFVMTGCATSRVPPMFHLGVPEAIGAARAGTVYVRHDSKYMRDGNSYSIVLFVYTNCTYAPYLADIATNRLPRRVHLDLSIDGGTTWPRRIAYGAQSDDRLNLYYVWAPPMDYSLMTTNARIRATQLDGSPVGRRGVAPWDPPPGWDQCDPFTIAGIVVDYPAGGETLYTGVNYTIRWRQTGGEGVTRICWMTPETVCNVRSQVMGVCSNTVSGTNTFNFTLICPPTAYAKIVILCDSDPNLIGYSEVFEVD